MAQNAPAKFLLEFGGKPVGKADYQFAPAKSGFRVKAHYSFAAGASTIEATRDAELGPAYELKLDSLDVEVNGAKQTVLITPDTRAGKINYEAGVTGGNQVTNVFDLHPATVVLNNFDPSGVQELIYLDVVQPQPDHRYWALLAQGKGMQLPIELISAEAGRGTLNGASVELKHWHLNIGGAVGDVWADGENNLMAFAVPVQRVAYRRSGFVLKEADEEPASAPTPGAEAVQERSVSFTSDGLKIPAVLALPKNRKGPVPIVVLVHGSGPHDADESIGPNKPLRDLAYGLAANGIATLRYDKRTHFAPDTFKAHPDLDHEVTLDAVAALACVSTLPEVDTKRVFLLGHSLGGTMAPVIAADRLQQAPGSVRGLIFLAGGALGIEETLERQLIFQAKRQGADASQVDAIRKQWQEIFQTVNNPATPEDQMVGSPPLRLPEGYWRSWVSQDPAGELAKLGLPALVLRGTKDIQISEDDFQALKKANVAPGSVSREIDGLNHLMMPVAGDSTGAEYFQPAHLAPEVIQIIAEWVGAFD
ncbi:MAG TPA: alpha/beta fold hydrolase [Silvibacterium sp.]|nr:alpha/beta fold hydrolase [Silvibacterium sp.]